MDTAKFWELIDETFKMSNGNMDQQMHLLLNRLLEFDKKEIMEFKKLFSDMRQETYRAALWDACFLIGCGCSDSVFMGEFSGWLIAQGKTVFDNAIRDPETLTTLVEVEDREEIFDGRLTDVADLAYEQKIGQEMPIVDWSRPFELIGEFTPHDNLPQKFPQLFAKFGQCD